MEQSYALVAYLPSQLGEFLDGLRRRLNPSFGDWLSHITILPPRAICSQQEAAITTLRDKCHEVEPFAVTLGDISAFWPVTGVVYLSLSSGFPELLDLHRRLNCKEIEQKEQYSYFPHITIAQGLDENGVLSISREASMAWATYKGERSVRIELLSLVNHTPDNRWVNIAQVPLGKILVPSCQ